VKPRLLGHFGTVPGLNLVYAHLNRVIRERDLDTIYITGPGHGGPGLVANAYLEGTYSEVYPSVTCDLDGLGELFRQFSFPGGIPSHVAPETPGSIHEGGELGYALSHAYGAAFDNPDLLVACVIGDGEAETGPLATSWHSNKLLNPATDGAVLPILHLNGYKIANPTILDRIPMDELRSMLEGSGTRFTSSRATTPRGSTASWRAPWTRCSTRSPRSSDAPARRATSRDPTWPMIVLRTPKGWTGPKTIDGKPVEGNWRSHQVPMSDVLENKKHLDVLEKWMRSYRPEELFDADGAFLPELRALAPAGPRRMSANPHANGGELLTELRLPDFRDFAVKVDAPATTFSSATGTLGQFLREVIRLNPRTFRLFGPDETASNRLQAVFEVTNKAWMAELHPDDELLHPTGG
jgi:xylulose-5-phosphate/fructose-6-phosphate phosphoketolase